MNHHHHPNRYSGLETDSDVEMETETRQTRQSRKSSSGSEAKDSEEIPRYIKEIMEQLAELTTSGKTTSDMHKRIFKTLDDLVDKIANMQLQITDVKTENARMNDKFDALEKRIATLESKHTPQAMQPTTYSLAVSHNLPPKPVSGNNTKQGKQLKPVKMLQSPYPKPSREVLVSFENPGNIATTRENEDKALEKINDALMKSSLNKRIFHGARFTLSNNLIFTTGLYDTNSDLTEHTNVIEETLEFIGIGKATLLAPWTKYLLHGVPTQMDLNTIRRDVESYCPGVKLGQSPRWLAPEEKRIDKQTSTVVLAFLGDIKFSELGARTILVGNRSCNLTKYIQFGSTTQCLNCQSFGHPKEFCEAGPKCAVCAGDHLTAHHQCPTKVCKGGYSCTHQDLKCVNCNGPHRSANRNCPEKVKRSQEFRELMRQRVAAPLQ